MKALYFSSFGDAHVLEYGTLPDPVPQAGEALVQVHAAGLNFADVYRRQGNYHLTGKPPYINGYEGAGVVVALGPGVTEIKKGARVAFADAPCANAELVTVPVEKLIPLPEDVSFTTAAAVLLQGLTAQYLTRDSYLVTETDVVVVHAAAGGVGGWLVQMCKRAGAQVIGLTSSQSKAQTVTDAGADAVFLYGDDWVKQIHEYTGGRATVVYESVGTTLLQSLSAVQDGGAVVFFGFAAGNPPLVDPRLLMDGSKTLTGGDLWTYLSSKEERLRRSRLLFEAIANDHLRLPPIHEFSLADGAAAHRFLESRQSTGKIVLIP